ncbi:hypothetical protein ACQP00_12460 [Dactylosporangium sp. CS-047395]|uniref:hypothetical protein n=1 Tax=Dactylosporangium sp. CS-047395 TaxID=3239936 RepID=UPI003D8BBCB3
MSVLVGVVAFAIAAVAWHFAHAEAHLWPALTAAGVGLAAVGLAHTRTWTAPNRWGKRPS